MKPPKAIQRFMDLWEQVSLEIRDGFYPDAVDWVPGYIVVAGLDPGKDNNAPMLTIISEADALEWLTLFGRYRSVCRLDLIDAFFEARSAMTKRSPSHRKPKLKRLPQQQA